MRKRRMLIACETSGALRRVMRALGHDAVSCDILPADDGSPHHIQDDVLRHLDDGWDDLYGFPPCTYVCVSGLHWNKRVPGRAAKTEEAIAFFRALHDAPIERIALENPVGCLSTRVRLPDQIIQPYEFGHDASKKTCLWLKGLPLLVGTKFIEPRYSCSCGTIFDYSLGKYGCPNCCGEGKVRPIWGNQTPSGQNKLGPSADRWKIRSQTYQGIADAMGDQWGDYEAANARLLAQAASKAPDLFDEDTDA